jgi:MFS family permease
MSDAPARRWLLLAVLVLVYVLAFIDRQLLSLLVEPLKHDFNLSDTQVGLMQGFVFAAFLAVTGIPLGQLIDRGPRIKIIAVGLVAWSLMTAATTLAASFAALLVCRAGVAIGEATLTPSAHSIIADSFPRKRLGLALGVFGIGSYVGAGLALLLGAAILTHLPTQIGRWHSWRLLFLIAGAPGLGLGALVLLFNEPGHRANERRSGQLHVALQYYRTHGYSIFCINLSAAFCAMAVYGANAWIPSLLVRRYGWTVVQAGHMYGMLLIGCGVTGVIVGGALADLLVARQISSARPLLMMLCASLAIVFSLGAPLAATPRFALLLFVPFSLLTTMTLGILPSAQQAITPSHLRATNAALGVLTVNLIGLGLGPTLIGLLSDRLGAEPMALQKALAVILPCALAASAACAGLSLKAYGRSNDSLELALRAH